MRGYKARTDLASSGKYTKALSWDPWSEEVREAHSSYITVKSYYKTSKIQAALILCGNILLTLNGQLEI